MNRAMMLMLAGILGAAVGWAIREPTAPANYGDIARWSQWESMTGLILGLLIGLCIGLASGWMQGSKTHMLRGAGFGALLGAIGGSLGITLGSVIFEFLQRFLGDIGRIMGWSVFGALIGLSEGVVGLSAKRAWYGLIGGLLGGILGGAAFVVTAIAVGNMTQDVSGSHEVGTIPRAVGFICIGGGIGLLIGIIEALSRKAWIRLVLGRNEGKDWAIDSKDTFIGRSEGAHIPLYGDPNILPMHAAIQHHGGRYYVTALNPAFPIAVNGQVVAQAPLGGGEAIQIGSLTLQFQLRGGPKAQPTYTSMTMPPHGQGFQTHQMPIQQPSAPMLPSMPTQMQAPISNPTVAAPAMGGLVKLVGIEGPLTGQSFPISAPTEVGRETGPIPFGVDSMVSRRHAMLAPGPGGIQVTDLGSTNGVTVNGTKIQSQFVRIGEDLQIGASRFRVQAQ